MKGVIYFKTFSDTQNIIQFSINIKAKGNKKMEKSSYFVSFSSLYLQNNNAKETIHSKLQIKFHKLITTTTQIIQKKSN